MYSLLRPLLFMLDPERAHSLTLQLMGLVGAIPPLWAGLHKMYKLPNSPVQVFGLNFPNAVGLAAGYDKDGIGWRGLASLGFGHIEVGTVTPLPQPGNPKPRVFRLVSDQALINRLGFPGRGAAYVHSRLPASLPSNFILGINMGKNKDTPNEEAVSDYISLMDTFAPRAHYLTVNVSSPNTVGLRRLQAREALEGLLNALAIKKQSLSKELHRNLPILVKLAPDLNNTELDDALEAILNTGMDGVIATNTTIQRKGLRSRFSNQKGGLSGLPLNKISNQMVKDIYKRANGKLPIIGVGGIMSPEDAAARLESGASLVQVYTGLIYNGPSFVKEILLNLAGNLQEA